MNRKAVFYNVGKALLVNALFMLVSVVISVVDGCDDAFVPLVISFMLTAIVGAFPFIFVGKVRDYSLKDGFVTIILSWILSFLFGALPYLLYGGEFNVINAWFESVSGYTTTGSTILTDIEALPRSLLFWRSSTHFIGGLGVVVFLLLIIPDASPFKYRLSSLEISSMSRTGYRYRSGMTVRVMLSVYVGLALAETILLRLAGMSWFDAVNHSFSTVATGGFSTRNISIMYYDSPVIDIIILVFMTLASIHFGCIYAMLIRRSLKPLLNTVTKYYLKVIVVLSVAIMLVLLIQGGYSSPWKALLDSSFQVVSFISTTGFGQADNAIWPFFANFLLIFASVHCGCSGSTTGGIKADRMFIISKAVSCEFKKRLHPSSVFRVKVNGSVVREDEVSSVVLYFVAYIIVLFLSFIAILVCGVDIQDAMSGTIASLGNVGPGLGQLGTMGNYASLPSVVKFIFSLDMFLGRVEIFPVLIVFYMFFKRK